MESNNCIIQCLLPNNIKGENLSPAAVNMPVKFGNKVIGFISNVTSEVINITFWTTDWSVGVDEETGEEVELNLNYKEPLNYGDLLLGGMGE
jgi:hypothetical protein